VIVVTAGTLQLAGYAMIANLAYRTAETGNVDVVMALYDLSSMAFTIAFIPLAVFVAAASGGRLRIRTATRVIGWAGFVVAALLLAGGGSLMRTRMFQAHQEEHVQERGHDTVVAADASLWRRGPQRSEDTRRPAGAWAGP
jgi:hypothetical protein